jgi:hypothetical protein
MENFSIENDLKLRWKTLNIKYVKEIEETAN